MKDARTHLFDRPENIRTVLRVFYAVCLVLLSIDIFFHRHVVHAWEGLWGFYAVYGFVACVALVLVAKLMRQVLMREERYYERDRPRRGTGR